MRISIPRKKWDVIFKNIHTKGNLYKDIVDNGYDNHYYLQIDYMDGSNFSFQLT